MAGGLAVIVVVMLLALVIGLRLWSLRLRDQRRDAWRNQPFPTDWHDIIEQRVPFVTRLPEELQQQLQGLIQIFLNEKEFTGCEGLEITDEIRVTIAAQACLLLLNRETRLYPKLKTIYVYPHAYVARSLQQHGTIVTEQQDVRLGESWTDGPLVLSWDSVTGGARNLRDGQNVVLHEFAHQLDQEDGRADGAPILASRSCYRSWAEVLGHEYEDLCNKAKHHRRSVLNKYGTGNPAEFFAVATEAFFEKPKQMHRHHPELYEELKDYYQLDPLSYR